ncbi:site-specific integrase [Streptomyces sp. ISL-94]|uniref:site-specific integrase n=1 Tax=Streptomyces sp. ISL-94 TaxID=2819190 RepID=UPI001BEA5EE9|nr:site-specific integrase [Streptomyces sp. ISL-94]MBT2480803.1 site-specific integrase [Streptomyces sp. ISL-94]
MLLTYFTRDGWESWDLGREPLIRENMPVLVDDDLRFEDENGPRPTVAVNAWLRELPISGVPAAKSWKSYAQAVRSWLEFLASRSVHPFGEREDLRAALGAFAEYRLAGPIEARWDGSTWNQRITVLSSFYTWAVDNDHCSKVPFTYAMGSRYSKDSGPVETRRNTATVRRAQPHATMKYLEPGFRDLFLRALAGLDPDGAPDDSFRGRELSRNGSMGGLAVASGLRAQEFTYLLTYELPALPARRTPVPVWFPIAEATTKGNKARATWTSHGALADVHQYVELDRHAAVGRAPYRPPARLGPPLMVEQADWEGGRINGHRIPWRLLGPAERLRLVKADGTSPLVAVQSAGTPFVDWDTVFRRTSQRIRDRFEPRFPTVHAHALRHTFAMETLEALVQGYYQRAAALINDTGGDAGLALYLTKTDPLMILRDLLGHSSVTTTEIYLRRLDVQRIYRDAYTSTGRADDDAEAEAAAEFGDDI